MRAIIASAFLLTAGAPPPAAGVLPATGIEVPVFENVSLHFDPENPGSPAAGTAVEADGRVATRRVDLPEPDEPVRITALVTIRPIPKDDLSVHDPWDRAGNVRLRVDGSPDLEVLRFMTAYGGRTEHEVDVTHLAPLLRGECAFAAFIDTWVTPAWTIDFRLRWEPAPDSDLPTWAEPVFYAESFDFEGMPEGLAVDVEIPAGLERVVLNYISTGHCTDGRDEDEFVSKANVISVDGVVVRRFHPWRDDCRRFRALNPYTKRWSDGTWSSDYHRSGWCPSQTVLPTEIDLTDHLGPGRHTVRVVIEGVRPRGDDGHHGYWRVSGHLVGWDRTPRLWRN